jgi:hypothetical protein
MGTKDRYVVCKVPLAQLDITLVCKAWRDAIELRARTVWIKDAYFTFKGYMDVGPLLYHIYYSPDCLSVKYTSKGKVMLSGSFQFVKLEENIAVFKDLDCHPKYKKAYVKACTLTFPPALQMGPLAHDVSSKLAISEVKIVD